MSHPNILFVFADQLRYGTLGCEGNAVIRTPNIDRLAGEGAVFEQAFSSCPVCSPYRGQIVTGNYSHANGVMDNEYRLFDDQRTLPQRLGEHGYRSAFIGKWHVGRGPYTPENRYGFDDMIAYNCNHNYYEVSHYRNEDGPFPMEDYAPRVETKLTLDWIAEHREAHPDSPFCAVLGWGPPHWCFGDEAPYGQYPEEYKLYSPEDVEVPGNVPVQFRDFAAREIADYYGMVVSLDECMGRLMGGLDEMGLGDDTIVCFSSDHGDHLSAHGYVKPGDSWMHHTLRLSKCTPHEESIHIPFIVRFPQRVAGGRRTRTLFNSVDVLPTLMGLCGLPSPDDVHGRVLSHAALGTRGDEPDSVYLQILGPAWPGRIKMAGMWRGIRTHEHTYARWWDRDGMRVLYDLREDPLEMHNVADDPQYADVAARCEGRLKQWIEETGDPFDTGRRLGETEMLDIGQAMTSRPSHDHLPPVYRKALEPNYAHFQTGERVVFP